MRSEGSSESELWPLRKESCDFVNHREPGPSEIRELQRVKRPEGLLELLKEERERTGAKAYTTLSVAHAKRCQFASGNSTAHLGELRTRQIQQHLTSVF